ncbi:hypothetical protein DITRI_Ditri04bG0153200 [Diplodiscus trichospermus]
MEHQLEPQPLLPRKHLWADHVEEDEDEEEEEEVGVGVALLARSSRHPNNGVGTTPTSRSELEPVPALPSANRTSSQHFGVEDEEQKEEEAATADDRHRNGEVGDENEEDKVVKEEGDGIRSSVYFDQLQGTESINETSEMHSKVPTILSMEVNHQRLKNVGDKSLSGLSPALVEQLHEETNSSFKHFNNATKADANVDLIGEIEEDLIDLDVEKVLEKQNTHDLYCPNCNSCITRRVILRRRKPQISNIRHKPKRVKKLDLIPNSVSDSHDDDTPVIYSNVSPTTSPDEQNNSTEQDQEAFSCLSCFSLFIPIGNGCFKIFQFFRQGRQEEHTQSPQEISQRQDTQSPLEIGQRENIQSPQGINPIENTESLQEIAQRENFQSAQGINLIVDAQSPQKISQRENKESPQEIGQRENTQIRRGISSTENTRSPEEIRQRENTQSPQEIGQRENIPSPQGIKPIEYAQSLHEISQRENTQSPQDMGQRKNIQSPQGTNAIEYTQSPQEISQNGNTETPKMVSHNENIHSPKKRSQNEKSHSPQHINHNEDAQHPQNMSCNEDRQSPENLSGNENAQGPRDIKQNENKQSPLKIPTAKTNWIFSIFAFRKGKATAGKVLLKLFVEAGHASAVQSAGVPTPSVTNREHIDGAAIKPKEPGISNIFASKNSSRFDKVKAQLREEADAGMFQRNSGDNEIEDIEAGLLEPTLYPRIEVAPSSQSRSQNEHRGADAGEAREWEILKSIVYGGLIESITSLGVVSSAAGAGADTLNVLALGLANLIGGLLILGHNLRELKNDQPRGASTETNIEEDRYQVLLGRRQNFALHVTVAILSFLIFGLVPPVVYGFSFRKSDDKDLKLAAVAGASLICIILLALGKGHVRKPHRTYFRTLSYYVALGIMVSGVSYLFGELIKKLLEQLRLFESSSAVSMPYLETIPLEVGRAFY